MESNMRMSVMMEIPIIKMDVRQNVEFKMAGNVKEVQQLHLINVLKSKKFYNRRQ